MKKILLILFILSSLSLNAQIVTHPVDISTCEGLSATFTATTVGGEENIYWQGSSDAGSTWITLTNNITYSGTSSTNLNISDVDMAYSNYQAYRLVAYKSATGSSMSNMAYLDVQFNDPIEVPADACNGYGTISATSTPISGFSGYWSIVSAAPETIINNSLSNTTTLEKLNAGVNEFQWTLTNGTCSTSENVSITNIAPILDAGDDIYACATSTYLSATDPSPGTGTWTVISGGANVTNNMVYNSEITNLVLETSNTLEWTVEENGCIVSETINVINKSVNADAGDDLNVCDSIATLPASVPIGGDGFWTTVNGDVTIVDETLHYSQVTGLPQGTPVTFSWTLDNAYCSHSDDVIVTNIQPLADAGPDDATCSSSYNLAANDPSIEGATGWWESYISDGTYDNSLSNNTFVRNLNQGVNILVWHTYNSTYACENTDTITITNNSVTTADAGSEDINTCIDNATISGNTPSIGTGSWSLYSGIGDISEPLNQTTEVTGIPQASSTEFEWKITNGTCTSTDVILVTNNLPNVSAGADQTVCVDSAILSGTAPSGGGSGYWEIGTGLTGVTLDDNLSATTTARNLAQGDNKFIWHLMENGCENTDTVIITNNSVTIANAGSEDINTCIDNATISGNTPSIGTGSWSLYSGSGDISEPLNQTTEVTGIPQGSSTEFEWKITNGACTSTDVILVTNNLPNVSAGADQTVCVDSAILSGTAPSGGGSGYWEIGTGLTGVTLDDNLSATTTARNLVQGDNKFIWHLMENGCENTDTIIITNNAPTVANAGSDKNFCGTSTNLSANTPVYGTGEWSLSSGSGVISSPTDPASLVTEVEENTSSTFIWKIDNNGCISTDEVVLTSIVPFADAGVGKAICEDTYVLQANDPGAGGTAFWEVIGDSPAIFDDNLLFNTSVSNLQLGDNKFVWHVFTEGCESTDSVIITNDKVTANAGNPQIICTDNTNLGAKAPIHGTGSWKLISGTGAISNINNSSTFVSGIERGTSTFEWKVMSQNCTAFENIDITNASFDPDAGPDVSIYSETETLITELSLAAPTLLTGYTGTWKSVNPDIIFAEPNNNTTLVQNLPRGKSRLVWEVTNGNCTFSDDMVATSGFNFVVDDGGEHNWFDAFSEEDITDGDLVTLVGTSLTVDGGSATVNEVIVANGAVLIIGGNSKAGEGALTTSYILVEENNSKYPKYKGTASLNISDGGSLVIEQSVGKSNKGTASKVGVMVGSGGSLVIEQSVGKSNALSINGGSLVIEQSVGKGEANARISGGSLVIEQSVGKALNGESAVRVGSGGSLVIEQSVGKGTGLTVRGGSLVIEQSVGKGGEANCNVKGGSLVIEQSVGKNVSTTSNLKVGSGGSLVIEQSVGKSTAVTVKGGSLVIEQSVGKGANGNCHVKGGSLVIEQSVGKGNGTGVARVGKGGSLVIEQSVGKNTIGQISASGYQIIGGEFIVGDSTGMSGTKGTAYAKGGSLVIEQSVGKGAITPNIIIGSGGVIEFVNTDKAVPFISLNDNTAMTIMAGGSVVTNDLTGPTFTLEPTASLVDWNSTTTTPGWNIIKRNVTVGEPNFVVPLLKNQNNVFSVDVYKWTESDNTWNIASDMTTIAGYKVNPTASTISYTNGAMNGPSIDFQLGLNSNIHGWNLVGNPFPSAVDIETFDMTNISNAIYVYDHSIRNFRIYQKDGVTVNGALQYIKPGQAFFVRAAEDAKNFNISHKNRTHFDPVIETNNIVDEMLRLQVGNDGITDEAVLYFNSGSTDGFEKDKDVLKLMSPSAEATQLYFVKGELKYAVNAIENPLDEGCNYPLSFSAASDGNYTLSANELSISSDIPIYLEDKVTGTIINLHDNQSYSFDYKTIDDDDRFVVHFNSTTGFENLEDYLLNNVTAYAVEKNIYVTLPENKEYQVDVYNVLGTKVVSKEIRNKGINIIEMNDNSQGVYIVRVQQGNNFYRENIYIK